MCVYEQVVCSLMDPGDDSRFVYEEVSCKHLLSLGDTQGFRSNSGGRGIVQGYRKLAVSTCFPQGFRSN